MTGTAFLAIALDEIHESKTNPRKTFDKAALAELIESVRTHGVLSPVMLRQVGKGYELVAGARRFRAAKAAGLERIPAVVRPLDDKQVLEIQVIENLQRSDLSPLEEARGYDLLHRVHGYDVDTLAAKVGKSKAYVYGRMRLCQLPAKVLKLLEEDKLTVAQAQLVARIPVPEIAAKAAEDIAANDDGEMLSIQESRRIVHEDYFLRLDQAPFDTGANALVEGVGSCGSCPKRTGNQKGLFDDVDTPDLCTDAKCFAAKKAAAWENQKADAQKAGQKVLEGKEAEKVRYYGSSLVNLDEVCYDDPKRRTYRKLLGKVTKDLPTVLVQDDRGGGEVRLERADLRRALKTAGHDFAAARRVERATSLVGKAEKARKRRLAAAKLASAAIAAAAGEIGERELLQFWFRHGTIHSDARNAVGNRLGVEFTSRNYTTRLSKAGEEWLEKATVAQLRGLLVELVAWSGGGPVSSYGPPYSEQWKAACELAGVKMAPFEQQVDAAAKAKTKPKARASAKPKARKGKAVPA